MPSAANQIHPPASGDSSSRWPRSTRPATFARSSSRSASTRPRPTILVIDDNSPDGTGRIADEIKAEWAGLHVIHRPGKLGLGTAVLAAMDFAIANGFDYLLNMDADFSHPPRFIPAIVAGMRDHDVMIGSRYVPGGRRRGGVQPQAQVHEHRHQRVRPAPPGPEDPGQQRLLPLLPGGEARRDRLRRESARAATRSWKKSSSGAGRSAAGSGETPILFENRRAGVTKINKYEAYMALKTILELGVGRVLRKPPVRKVL